MILYLTTTGHERPMRTYLDTWGRALADRIRIVLYEELPGWRRLPAATYVFGDLERLSPPEAAVAKRAHARLVGAGLAGRLLNDPARSRCRYDLLDVLHAAGRNRFRAVRVVDPAPGLRYPVFLREEHDHGGSLGGLLEDEPALRRAVRRAVARGFRRDDLLAVEFCPTADTDGIYRKWSAFRVGETIVPRHLVFSRAWMLKYPDLVDEPRLREEDAYLDGNPHEPWLREIFDLARIEYGRIDYGMAGGAPQVWEINTNPMVLLRPERYDAPHLPAQERFAARIRLAFEAIDDTGDAAAPDVPFELEGAAGLARRIRAAHRSRRARRLCQIASWQVARLFSSSSR